MSQQHSLKSMLAIKNLDQKMEPQKTTAELPKNSPAPQRLSELSFAEFARTGAKRPPPTPEQIAESLEADRREKEKERALQAQRRKRNLATQMGVRYEKCSLANYGVKFVEQKNAIEAIKEFLSAVTEHVSAGRGLILYGSVGTGKDHLLAACLFAAIDAGFGASWKNAQAIYEAARDQMDGKGSEREMLSEFTTPHILGLSDPTPPAGDLTGFRVELLWRIADIRYRMMKPIWLTMNANSIEECQAKLSVPLWDRLQDNAVCVPCFWPSFRVKVTK